MKILALDWGEKRIGAAVCDEEGRIAFAAEEAIDSQNSLLEIKKIIETYNIERILIGKPLTLSGVLGSSGQKAGKFAADLAKEITLPVEFLDERFSSVQAGKMLHEEGISEKKQRKVKDNIAAQIILQSYLDKQNESR